MAFKPAFQDTIGGGGLTPAQETKLNSIQFEATKNLPDATLLARENHTGTQGMATVDGLGAALDTKMEVGAGGWLGRADTNSYMSGYPQDISQNVSQIYRRDSVDEGVSAFASSIHFAANDTWGRLRVEHNNQRAWIQGGTDQTGIGWTGELLHTGNTIVDTNGFIKEV